MENITTTSFVMEISTFGKVEQKYNDTNRERFLEKSFQILKDLERRLPDSQGLIRNVHVHFYTE